MPPVTRKRVNKAKGYQRPDTDGKLFRVRDKDYSDGQPVTIWGENLTYESAHDLKEKVTGSKRSRTARIEEMSVSMPSADPTIEAVRQKGLAAGRGAAAAAQQRADQLALRRRQEAQAASAPKKKIFPKAVAKPVPMELDPDLETPDVEDEDEIDEGDDVAAVTAGVDDDINEYEQRGKDLYERWQTASGGAVHGSKSWDQLAPKDQAAFSFEATAEQGPHIDLVRAAAAVVADESAEGSSESPSPNGMPPS